MRNMRDPEEMKHGAQHYANEQQEPMALFMMKDGRFDFYPQARFDRDQPGALLETIAPEYRYMDDIKKRNARIGNHWFEPSTMRFFGSRVHGAFYGRGAVAYFVTSEKPPHARRAYSVRRANADGTIDTVGEFCGYRTGRQAHARAAWIAEHGEEVAG